MAVVTLLAGGLTAHAQSDAAGSSGDPDRLVILNVPGGGTDPLVSELQSLDQMELESQEWFIEQLERHGLEPQGIMSNREGLRTLMRKSEVDYLLFLKPDADHYTATLLEGPEAEAVLEFEVERADDALPAAEAETITARLSQFLAPDPEDASSESGDEPLESDEADTSAAANAGGDGSTGSGDDPETAEEEDSADAGPGVRFRASARGRLFRRNLNVAGADTTILAFASRFYPGFEVDAQLFPFAPVADSLAGLGLYVDYNQGFETVTTPTESGDSLETFSLTHTEIEGGLVTGTAADLPVTGSPASPGFQLKATVRTSWFIVDQNTQLPSTSLTAVTVGGRLTEPLIGERLAAQARLEVIPVAFFQRGGALFGETSYTNGFATRLGVLYALSDHISLVGGYRFRLHHATFRGRGASGFRDAEVFELVQGIDVGIQYGR